MLPDVWDNLYSRTHRYKGIHQATEKPALITKVPLWRHPFRAAFTVYKYSLREVQTGSAFTVRSAVAKKFLTS